MAKHYRGIVQGGVVVLEPGVDLPEGTQVEVIAPEPEFQPDWSAAWRTVGAGRDREGRSDVSERVDEFLIDILLQDEEGK